MTIPRVKRNQVWKIHWIRVCFLPGPPGLRCRERTLSLCQFVFKVKLTSLEERKRSSGIISVLFTVLHTPWGRVTATDFFFFFLPHHVTCKDLSSQTRDWKHWVLCWVTQSCPTVCEPLDCSLPGSPLHGDSPGKDTGVGFHALLQGIFPNQEDQPLGIP